VLAIEMLMVNNVGIKSMVEKSPREYRMKIDLPSFDGHLHIEDFLD
jgi:hypothetical protein